MAKDERIYEDVVCVIGINKDGKPIWKKVGVKTKTKSSNRDVILLDRTFNPAGVVVDDNTLTSIPLYFFKQDKEGEEKREPHKLVSNGFNDFEDDIPF